ncbi:hydrogenase maturation protein [Nitratifractor salsuginis]|uniref:Formyl transferase domain protein n=1 Tax=Nitratifractor salsuginis (strain DSM 16511 / JCM 12458 / E9I37-1) TaxID=749222 RepID=E6WYB4_NITSE|nr:hydrogenase maturation protein [Nitratifractor salsuginis]ADV45362.1 formyl transferase domain protein [Nitratifractor salsuginis DSM 16511]
MRVLLLVSAFNSLSQQVFCRLEDLDYEVSVEFARSEDLMEEAVKLWKPDLILCPYLMQKVPETIWQKTPTIIVHPGPPGDRGPSSLDWAVLRCERSWGVTLLQANEEMDGGDIWASGTFVMPEESTKGRIYRREVGVTTLHLIEELLHKFENPDFTPQPQGVLAPMHPPVRQGDRAIDWEREDTETILRKVNASDNHPGVKEELLGLEVYLYGAHREGELRGAPKEILAKRNGAVCLGTIDGAVWISHLKEPHRFKLPATYVLKERLKGIKERRIPLYVDPVLETFKEITFVQEGRIGYLGFDFYNGAMSAEQCIRLKYAVETLWDEVDLLVLTGGPNFFSNGIHLTILEESKKQGEDGWSNINAMNNLIEAILFSDDILTVASFGANAGAGGVFLGLACDFAVAREGVVLNPHYKTMGLSGSEYHSYTLSKRVGEERAKELLEACLPVSAKRAEELGMIDALLEAEGYDEALKIWCRELLADEDRYYDLLDEKRERLERDREHIDACKEAELKRMHPEFWDPESDFHRLRHDFVYKVCPTRAPDRIARHRREESQCTNTP